MKKLLLLLLLFIPSIALGQTSNPRAVVGGGYTPYNFNELVGTVQTVKGTHVTIGGWRIFNPAATDCYVQMFNVASATTVTLGTTVPTNSIGYSTKGGDAVAPVLPGVDYTLGLKIAGTTTATGSTPCGTGLVVNFWYK